MRPSLRHLTRADYVVLSVSALVVLVASVLLFFEARRPSSGIGGRAIGEITYRNRVAQRRDPGRVIWADVNPGDAVYDGDSARTGESAEAVIELADGSKVELDPESLIVLSLREKAGIRLLRGSMILRPGPKGAELEYGERKYTAEGQSVRVAGDENAAEAEAGEGSSLRQADGNIVLRSGESAQLKNRTEVHLPREIRPLAPIDNARFFVATGGRAEVDFRWSPAAGAATLEVMRGRFMDAAPVLTPVDGGRATLALGEGSYYWRLRRGNELSPLRRFRVREKEALVLLQPRPDATLSGPGEKPTVAFRWKEHELASSYYFEVAKDRGFSDRVVYETVQRVGISLQLPPGNYYWRAMVKGSVPGADTESAARAFTVVRESAPAVGKREGESPSGDMPSGDGTEGEGKPAGREPGGTGLPEVKKNVVPARPVLVYPSPGSVVDMTGSNALLFRWSGDASVERAFALREGRSGRVVFQTRVRGNSYALTDLTVLDTGPFEWAIEDQGSLIRARFTIVLRETLEKPKLEIR